MSLLADCEIMEAKDRGEIEIDPFDEENLQPASYDVRLGGQVVLAPSAGPSRRYAWKVPTPAPVAALAAAGAEVHIPSGGFALVLSLERIKLADDYACTIGYHSELARRGVFLLAGLQVDPGFDGHLVVGLINYLQTYHTLRRGDPIITLEFYRLRRPAEKAFRRERLEDIAAADVDYVRASPTTGMADVGAGMERLANDLENLRGTVNVVVFPLMIGVILAIVAFGFKLATSL